MWNPLSQLPPPTSALAPFTQALTNPIASQTPFMPQAPQTPGPQPSAALSGYDSAMRQWATPMAKWSYGQSLPPGFNATTGGYGDAGTGSAIGSWASGALERPAQWDPAAWQTMLSQWLAQQPQQADFA